MVGLPSLNYPEKMHENSYLVVSSAVVVSVEVGGVDDVGGEPPK